MYNESMAYGCLFCRSGSEERIIEELKNSFPAISCISPKRERVRRQGEKEIVTLFPGYIIFRTNIETDFQILTKKTDVYRLLRYPSGSWELRGSDLDIAMVLFEMGGIVGLSKARFEGNDVRIISGPLFKYRESIVDINKRSKTAIVEIVFQGKKVLVWLGFEIV